MNQHCRLSSHLQPISMKTFLTRQIWEIHCRLYYWLVLVVCLQTFLTCIQQLWKGGAGVTIIANCIGFCNPLARSLSSLGKSKRCFGDCTGFSCSCVIQGGGVNNFGSPVSSISLLPPPLVCIITVEDEFVVHWLACFESAICPHCSLVPVNSEVWIARTRKLIALSNHSLCPVIWRICRQWCIT